DDGGAEPVRARPHQGGRPRGSQKDPGRPRGPLRRRPGIGLGRAAALCLARDRGHQDAPALAGRQGQGALHGRRRGRRRRHQPAARHRRRRGGPGGLRTAARRHGCRGGTGGRSAAGPRGPRHQQELQVVARRLHRPVKRIEERSGNYLATIHGRGVLQDMELAATEDGKLLGIRAKLIADMGAYFQLITPGIPMLGAWLYGGCYRADAYWFEYTGVFTNQTPTDAYRGAGRPEATYAIERAMDALARPAGKDPAEVRRMNFVPPFSEPTALASGLQADSGDYEATLARALDLVGYEELRKEQQIRREQGGTRPV